MANAGGNQTRRKKVLIEVNISWKPWQPKIQYENTIEVDVRFKAELFFQFTIQMSECNLRKCLWEIFRGWENLVQRTTESCYCSLL